ncbi:hypothetical protein [Streptomyces sp. NPDC029003]|uniref:hypothetical protein n=1 Tax=Streptomyces sp. NPDC029003 TaxID=3155125 RepID=UPI0033FC79CE
MRTGSRTTLALTLALCGTAAAALTGCGGPARDGYVAVGAVGPGPERGAGQNVAPEGRVEFQSLPPAASASASSTASTASTASTSPGAPGSGPGAGSAPGGGTATGPGGSAAPPGTPPAPGTPTKPDPAGGAGGSGGSGSGGSGSGGSGSGGTPGTPATPGTPSTPSTPGTKPGTPPPPPPPATAARITLGAPARAAASERWCERVTVTFTNTGGAAARSGTVSFATHIIGALGVDWATITTSQPLPAPIAGGTSKTQTYTVCVEAWRVPLGMHVDTRNVTATWS